MAADSIVKEEGFSSDCYEGTRAALIRDGIAKASWFPLSPIKDKRGRVKRRFSIDGVTLVDLQNGKWFVSLPISDEEQAARDQRRRDAETEKMRDDATASCEAARRKAERFYAAPFDPATLTPAERGMVLMWRRLPGRQAETVLTFLELTAARCIPDAPRLQLVVDNTEARHDQN